MTELSLGFEEFFYRQVFGFDVDVIVLTLIYFVQWKGPGIIGQSGCLDAFFRWNFSTRRTGRKGVIAVQAMSGVADDQ